MKNYFKNLENVILSERKVIRVCDAKTKYETRYINKVISRMSQNRYILQEFNETSQLLYSVFKFFEQAHQVQEKRTSILVIFTWEIRVTQT